MRNLLDKFQPQPIYGILGPRKPEAYLLTRKKGKPIYVLGPYDDTPTSGVDVISTGGLKPLIALIEKYRQKGHVVMEGILISSNFGSVGEYLAEHKQDVIIARLDTPLEDCLSDLRKRQVKSSKSKDSGGDKHIGAHYKRALRACQLFAERGVRVEVVSRNDAVEKMLTWLN